MEIVDLKSKITAELREEIDSIDDTRSELEAKLSNAANPSAFCRSFIDTVYGKEFISRIVRCTRKKKLKILDIGFGRGESSLYLREQGHSLYALEPSALNCSLLSRASEKYNLPIQIFQGTAEGIDSIEEKKFDLFIFKLSLHHCDHPIQALRNCKQVLHSEGKVIAVNEPLLKFYR